MTIWSWLKGVGRPVAMVFGLAIGVAGCQAVQGDGPWMNGAKSGSTEAFPFDVIDLTPTTVVAYRPPATNERPSTVSNLSAGTRLTAAPGDVLKVHIFEEYAGGVFPTIQNPTPADLGYQRVTESGTIDVPYAGQVKVAGLDLRQIEHEIAGRLASQAKNPQVIVEFVADRTNTVMVSGNVKKPGRVSLIEGIRTVMDVINRAGGVVEPAPPPPPPSDDDAAGDSTGANASSSTADAPPAAGRPSQLEVVVRRHGEVILDKQLSELLAGGDIGIEKGDEIVVRPNPQVVTVLGAVVKAGNVPLTRVRTTLADVLGDAHGLFDLRSNKTGLYVFRLGDIQDNPHARARIFRLDFMQPSSVFVAQQFGIQPKDVIYVTNAPLYEYDKILSAIYRSFVIGAVATGNMSTSVGF